MAFKKTKFNRRRRFRKKGAAFRKAKKGDLTLRRSPLPTKFRARLRYFEQINISSVSGNLGTYVFSCNGIYDPNISGTGHQPRGFKELMPMYNRYTVIGSKICIDFSQGSSTNGSMNVGVLVKDGSGLISTFDDVMEFSNRSYKLLTGGDTGGDSKTVNARINPNKFLGVPSPLSEVDVQGTVSGNPDSQCFFHLFIFPSDNSGASQTVTVGVTIDYEVVFTEPQQPPLS